MLNFMWKKSRISYYLSLFLWLSADIFFVFFSSRRRHTSYIGDWSSDVCSSDLPGHPGAAQAQAAAALGRAAPARGQIGRASCRERVLILAISAGIIVESLLLLPL